MIYQDLDIDETIVIRTFDESIDPIELRWHRDDEHRTIVSISPSDWKIQLENRLPMDITTPIFIERGEWHRLIKGTGKLVVKIIKSYE